MDGCLTIIRNNQFSSRARTVKDYLSFILAVTIGLFRLEEGKLTRSIKSRKHIILVYFRIEYEDYSNVTNSRTYSNNFLSNYYLSCKTFSN